MQATLEAVRLRFRPIVMTSLAFGLGVLPLVISTGAGAASRNAVGTGVLGGMIAATVLAPLFVPMFFVLVSKIFHRKRQPHDDGQSQGQGPAPSVAAASSSPRGSRSHTAPTVRTTTALTTSPRLTLPPGMASLTVATMTSPMPA